MCGVEPRVRHGRSPAGSQGCGRRYALSGTLGSPRPQVLTSALGGVARQGVVETERGLVVALPYGTTPDWLKNVTAAGSAELVFEGETFGVVDPEVVPASETNAHASRVDRFLQRLYGVDQALLLTRVDTRVA